MQKTSLLIIFNLFSSFYLSNIIIFLVNKKINKKRFLFLGGKIMKRKNKLNYKIARIFIATILISSVLAVTVSVSADTPSGMVSYWKFDESSGTTASDSYGSNSGTISGATWTTGISGSALSFDGVNDYVLVPDDASIDFGTGDFTLEAWICRESSGSNHMIIDKREVTQACGYLMGIGIDNKVHIAAKDTSLHFVEIAGTTTISNNAWYHIVGVFDRDGNGQIYINGELDNSGSITSASGNLATNANLYIGYKSVIQSAWGCFDGCIDEVRVYNRALTSNEISEHYSQEILTAYWQFDEGSGSTVYDATEYNNDGTIYGATWTNGISGDALSFDGVDDYVTVSSDTSINFGTRDFSLESWICRESSGIIHTIFEKRESSMGIGYLFGVGADDKVHLFFKDSSYNTYDIGGTTTISNNIWYHVVGVIDRDGYGKIYVNGVLDSETPASASGSISNNGALRISRSPGGSAWNPFDGRIDEARIYKRLLTSNEILNNYEKFPVYNKETPVYVDVDTSPNHIDLWAWETTYSDEITIPIEFAESDGENLKDQSGQPKTVYLEYNDGANWISIANDILSDEADADRILEFTFNIIDKCPDIWPIQFRFDGDSMYNITIMRENVQITILSSNFDYYGTTTIEAQMLDDEGDPILLENEEPKILYLEHWRDNSWQTLEVQTLCDGMVSFSLQIPQEYFNDQMRVTYYGCNRYNSGQVIIKDYTLVADAGDDTSGCVGQTINFDGSYSYSWPDGHIVSYTWGFGDGASATSPIVAHTYSTGGTTYHVSLTVMDDYGNTVEDWTLVSIAGETPVYADVDTSPNHIDRWVWETMYSDEITITTQLTEPDGEPLQNQAGEPKTIYLEYNDGSSWITIANDVLSDPADTDKTLEFTFNIIDEIPDIWPIQFRFDGDLMYNPAIQSGITIMRENVQITILSSNFDYYGTTTIEAQMLDDEGDPILHQVEEQSILYLEHWRDNSWQMLDALVADNNDMVSFSLHIPQEYFNDQMRVIYIGSETCYNSGDVIVKDYALVADAGDDTSGCVGLTINFDGSNSYSWPAGHIISYTWDFGDGHSTTEYSPSVMHTYSTGGTTYHINLIIEDDLGNTAEDWTAVSIAEDCISPFYPPVANAGEHLIGLEDEAIFFDGSDSYDIDGTIVSWYWEFGDMNTDSGEAISHVYNDPGTYLVHLTVTDNNGLTDTTTIIVIAEAGPNNPPIAGFTYTPSDPSEGATIQLTDVSTDNDGTIVNWTWDFGDGTISYTRHPTHIYSEMAYIQLL